MTPRVNIEAEMWTLLIVAMDETFRTIMHIEPKDFLFEIPHDVTEWSSEELEKHIYAFLCDHYQFRSVIELDSIYLMRMKLNNRAFGTFVNIDPEQGIKVVLQKISMTDEGFTIQ